MRSAQGNLIIVFNHSLTLALPQRLVDLFQPLREQFQLGHQRIGFFIVQHRNTVTCAPQSFAGVHHLISQQLKPARAWLLRARGRGAASACDQTGDSWSVYSVSANPFWGGTAWLVLCWQRRALGGDLG
jgi:hypothetical protein